MAIPGMHDKCRTFFASLQGANALAQQAAASAVIGLYAEHRGISNRTTTAEEARTLIEWGKGTPFTGPAEHYPHELAKSAGPILTTLLPKLGGEIDVAEHAVPAPGTVRSWSGPITPPPPENAKVVWNNGQGQGSQNQR